jgi:hypothetical protein
MGQMYSSAIFWQGFAAFPLTIGIVLLTAIMLARWYRFSRRWMNNLPATQRIYGLLIWFSLGRLSKRYADFRWWNDRWYVSLDLPSFTQNPPKEVTNLEDDILINYPGND